MRDLRIFVRLITVLSSPKSMDIRDHVIAIPVMLRTIPEELPDRMAEKYGQATLIPANSMPNRLNVRTNNLITRA